MYAASAISGLALTRALLAFACPLFGGPLYGSQGLGFGWGFTLIAIVAAVIGIPGSIVLWKYGPLIRKHFARSYD